MVKNKVEFFERSLLMQATNDGIQNMKIRYLVLFFCFIVCFIPKSKAQKNISKGKSLHFEVSPFLGELQIKNYLSKPSPFGETVGVAYGGELAFGIAYKNGWGVNMGVHFLSQVFTNLSLFEITYSNPEQATISNNDFEVENLSNSFSNYNVAFTITQFEGTSCSNPAAPLQDGEVLQLNFVRIHPLQQIGIPIKIEKTIGKKRNKLYLGIGVMPTFTISSPQSSGKYRQTNQIEIHDTSLSRCYIANNVLRQIVVFQKGITFKNQNIKDARFDLTTELGLLNEGPNNSFKFTFFFNESFTGFTQVNDMQYQAQTVGLKFALRKSRYKSNTD